MRLEGKDLNWHRYISVSYTIEGACRGENGALRGKTSNVSKYPLMPRMRNRELRHKELYEQHRMNTKMHQFYGSTRMKSGSTLV